MIELSIIIPTYNRAARLRTCLESLCHQTQPYPDFEVIVVVDGSTDSTRETLATFTPPYELQVIWQENRGPSAARNRGLLAARGRYCLLLDDDMVAHPELAMEHLHVQRAYGGVVGIGQITLSVPTHANWFVRCYAKSWMSHYATLNQGNRPLHWTDGFSGNISIPRESLLAVGGFAVDVPRSEDVELTYRLEQHGLPLVYIPNALGVQDERKDFRELMADAEKAGVACVELCRRHPSMQPSLLGTFGEMGIRVALLQRLLLRLQVPPRLLTILGSLLRESFRDGRWFAFVYSYCYWRGVKRVVSDRATWRRLTRGTPILMYHAIGGPRERASRYIIPERCFALQMLLLRWMRYRVLSLEEFLCYRRKHHLLPEHSVVVTIDDGYADNLTRAYPFLRRHGFSATLFLVSSYIGHTNQWDCNSTLTGRPLLSRSAVQELLEGGVTIGAHTRSHPVLTAVTPERVRKEIEGSKVDLENEFGTQIEVFSYPYGEYNSLCQTVIEQLGFLGACSVEPGMNWLSTPNTALRRTEIYGTMSLFHFVLALKGLPEPAYIARISNMMLPQKILSLLRRDKQRWQHMYKRLRRLTRSA